LPSKTFYLLGASYSWNKFNPRKINFEYSDTGSREANVTYNHFIFKDGYRYYGIPIGSTYDADSKTKSISYHHQFNNNLNFNLRAVHGSLNYHSSNTFFIRGFSDDITMTEIQLIKRYMPNTYINVALQHLSFNNTSSYDNLSTNASIEFRW